MSKAREQRAGKHGRNSSRIFCFALQVGILPPQSLLELSHCIPDDTTPSSALSDLNSLARRSGFYEDCAALSLRLAKLRYLP